MRVFYLVVFCVYYVASASDKEGEIESHRKKLLDQLTRTRTVLREGYHLVTRQIATDVYMYRNYRTVSVVFYPIMRDVTEAIFTFQSEELHLNTIGSCSPEDVIVNLKHSSYPAVNPDGYSFPKGFIDPSQREKIHTIEIQSDGRNQTYSIRNPKPGNWYALVYIKWEDPRSQKVEQQGLVADCSTILYTDLQVKREEDTELVDCYTGVIINYHDLPAAFKCMSADSIEPINFNITITHTTADHVLFRVQALNFPTEEDYLISCVFDLRLSNEQTVTFSPNPSAWHYIQLEPVTGNISRYANCESYYLRTDDDDTDNRTVYDLMRDDKGRFFTFDYGLPTTDVQDVTSVVNITSNEVKTIRFKVNQFIDIGGSIAIETSLLMSWKYYSGYKRELKKGSLLAFTEDNQYMKAVVCLDIGHASIPLESGHCKYNDNVKPALFVLNSTDSESIYDKTIIPFPESGVWYISLRLFCDDVVCPCKTSHNGTKYYVEADLGGKEEDLSGELTANTTRPGVTKCNATLLLAVTSTSCVAGRCSNHGNCLLNTFGGLVMSFCSCSAGYGAWDCSDQSRMDSRAYMLISVLLLTLSNLLFMFSIYVATIRLYYTEAMMYAFTMVFSTFYHACDAPAQVAYCITRINILQFGDFYCGIMSFWVTLLAMSIISEKLRSTFQLTGAIIIALLTTWNMHSFVAFVIPVAVGVSILLFSWLYDYRGTKRFLYPKTYYTRYMPVGLVLVSVGLACFAFLQTEQNYKLVHSLWHMIIALSVAFLLPDVKRDGLYNAFVPSRNMCRFKFLKIFKRQPPTTVPDCNHVTESNHVAESNQFIGNNHVTESDQIHENNQSRVQ